MSEIKADIKVDEAELQQVKELRNNFQQIMLQIGQSELQISDLENGIREIEKIKKQLFEKYEELKKNERTKLDELNSKYGIGTLNVDTGLFTPTQ